jgi:hypothetical protein
MEINGRFLFTDLTAIIVNYQFYTDNESAIDQWLEDRGCERKGMVVKFSDEKVKTLFMMRWA